MMKVRIIGCGEVGQSIEKLIKEQNIDCDFWDEAKGGNPEPGEYQFVHVCFSCTDGEKFINEIIRYYKNWPAPCYIIHSTIPVGTTYALNQIYDIPAVHSPIRGMHPDLVPYLRSFIKYVSGDKNIAALAISHLNQLGMECQYIENSVNTELGKILSTTYYGWNILFAKLAKEIIDYYGADYDTAYTKMNETYNEGYKKTKKYNVIRPVLKPPDGKIGGHCVSQNVELLPDIHILKTIFKCLNK